MSTQQRHEHHEYANLFPMMARAAIEELGESIKRRGKLRRKIVLFENKVLDGRNREEACFLVGVTPTYRDYDFDTDGPDPLRFVLDENLERRHLNPGQAAAIATAALPLFEKSAHARQLAGLKNQPATPPAPTPPAGAPGTGSKVVTFVQPPVEPPRGETPELPLNDAGHGEGGDTQPDAAPAPAAPATGKGSGKGKGRASQQAANAFGTSEKAIRMAAELEKLDPDLFAQVKAGTMKLNPALKQAKLNKKDADEKAGAVDPALEALRTEHVETVRKVLGDAFAEAFKVGTILKTADEAAQFTELKPDEMKLIQGYLLTGWEVKRALKFVLCSIDKGDKIQSLLLRAANAGTGKFECEVGGWKIKLTLVK